MKKFALAYAGSAICMLALDIVWLSTMAERLYRPQLGALLADDFRPGPAMAFYALYIFGVVYFVVLRALNESDWTKAALDGAVLGLVAYGAYDLTNQATLRYWSILVTSLDLTWGAFLTAASAVAGYQAARRFSA